jgi:2-hydroxy-6-oxonona-2,4-dienedioate hydrolase
MSDAACTETWPQVRGLRIRTRSSTTAPRSTQPIVLIHGLGVSADYMLPTLVRLAMDFKVLAPELPGFGKSDKPSHVLDIRELADVLAEWVRAMDIPSAVFLGNSMGCQVIVDLAARYPLLVDAVILVGPTFDTIGHTMIQQLWRGLLDLIHEPWSLWRILARDYLRTGTRRIYRTFRFALQDDVLKKCLTITVPVLIVRGGYDTIAPARWVEEIANMVPEARVVTLANATHAANYSAPNDLVRVASEFLKSLPRH